MMFSNDPEGPVNVLIREAFEIARSYLEDPTGPGTDIEFGVPKKFILKCREIFEVAHEDGQGYVWKMRQAIPTEGGGLLFPGDEGYEEASGQPRQWTMTSSSVDENGKHVVQTVQFPQLDKK